jgi:hypothetical protein
MSDAYLNLLKSDKEGRKAIAILERIDQGEDVPHVEIHELLKARKARIEAWDLARSVKQAAKERRQNVGRAKSGKFEVAPRYENGTDFSAEGIILARMGDKYKLIWRYAGKHWSNLLTGYVSHGASLELHQPGPYSRNLPKDLLEGGRLTAKRIMEVAEKIDEIFGAGTAVQVAELKGTVTISEGMK